MALSMRTNRRQMTRGAPAVSAHAPRQLVVARGLLDSLFKGVGGSSSNPQVEKLAQELLVVAGSKGVEIEEIEDLVSELQKAGGKGARGKALAGKYEVVYASSSGDGSPLAGPSGSLPPLGSKLPLEVLEADGSFSRTVEFKALGGFATGVYATRGTFTPRGTSGYTLRVEEGSYRGGPLGGASVKELDESYGVEVLYLDDAMRVVEVVPEGGDEDDAVLVILRRAASASYAEAPTLKRGGSLSMKVGGKSRGGLATVAERQVLRQLAEEQARRGGSAVVQRQGSAKLSVTPPPARGSAKVARAAAKPEPDAPPRGGSLKLRLFGLGGGGDDDAPRKEGSTKLKRGAEPAAVSKAEPEAAPSGGGSFKLRLFGGGGEKREADAVAADGRAKAANQRGREKTARDTEAAALDAEKAQERGATRANAANAKESAGASKAKAGTASEIKDLLSRLSDEVAARQADAKAAAEAVKRIERENAGVLKKVAAARAKVAATCDETADALELLEQAQRVVGGAQAAVRDAEAGVAGVTKDLRGAKAKALAGVSV